MVGKVGFFVYLEALLVGCLGVSFLKVDLVGAVKKKRATSGFVLKVIIGGSLHVSGPCKLQLSCGDIYKLA